MRPSKTVVIRRVVFAPFVGEYVRVRRIPGEEGVARKDGNRGVAVWSIAEGGETVR
jgi:hypothetical protein